MYRSHPPGLRMPRTMVALTTRSNFLRPVPAPAPEDAQSCRNGFRAASIQIHLTAQKVLGVHLPRTRFALLSSLQPPGHSKPGLVAPAPDHLQTLPLSIRDVPAAPPSLISLSSGPNCMPANGAPGCMSAARGQHIGTRSHINRDDIFKTCPEQSMAATPGRSERISDFLCGRNGSRLAIGLHDVQSLVIPTEASSSASSARYRWLVGRTWALPL
jgi:hypothetical protein